MSQDNVHLRYRAIDAVNRRDLDAFLAVTDNQVEVVSRIVAVEGGLHGHEGVRSWWANWFETWPDYKIEVGGIRDMGDVTIASFKAVGHGAGSELPFEDNAWGPCRWRDGKCTWWGVFGSEADALTAVGLRE